MTIQIVPTFSDESYVQQTTLDGVTYAMQFDYNQRAASWYLSIADADGVDIANGVKLVTGFRLLAKCKDPRKPAGDLFVISATSDISPPTQFDLLANGRCVLAYITADWLAIFAAGGIATLQAQIAANTQASSTSTYGQGG